MGYLVEECISVMKIEGLPVIDDPDDYSFVVKRRGSPLSRGGGRFIVLFFGSMAEAAKDGKKALARLLSERAA